MAAWPPAPRVGAHLALLQRLSALQPCEELDFGELFAGEGRVGLSLGALGFRGRALDRDHQVTMDLLTPMGLVLAVRVACSIRPGGCMWLAPPCSSWVWLTRHSSGREICIEGDVTSSAIVAQNALAERVAFLLALCSSRGVYWIVEQPASSVLWNYPAIRQRLQEDGLMHPTVLDMGAFGGSSVKPTHLWGTAPYLAKLARTCDGPQRLQLRVEGVQTTHRSVDSTGRRRCQGTRDLKGTQAYPWGFGAAHALAFAEAYGRPAASGLSSPEAHVAAVVALLETHPCFRDAWWLQDLTGEPF